MTSFWVVIALLWAHGSCSIGMQGAPPESVNWTLPQPQTQRIEPQYVEVSRSSAEDAGRVVLGERAERTITLKNVSKAAVELTIVRKSCGCVESRFDSARIEPGAETTLHLAVLVLDGTGEQIHTVVVEAQPVANGQGRRAEPQQQLVQLRFTPDRMYEVRPQRLLIRCIAGEAKEAVVSVGRLTRGDLKISDCFTSVPHVTFGEPKINSKNAYVQLLPVKIQSDEPGEWTGMIEISTNSARAPRTRVPVKLEVLSAWRPEPAGAILPLEIGSEAVSVDIRLTRRSSTAPAPAEISTESPAAGVKALLIISTKSQGVHGFRVRVTVDPKGGAAGAGTTSLNVVDKDGRVLAVLPIAWYTHHVLPPKP